MAKKEINPFVYIRGVKERGNEVINLLEKHGGRNVNRKSGQFKSYLYYIDFSGFIECTGYLPPFAKEKYTELFLPENKKDLQDKDLVWAFDKGFEAIKIVGFYCAETDSLYSIDGFKGGLRYDHYEPFDGEYPEWARKAIKKLKDY